ncbi:hypothetical protein BC937DRAFT_93520 [Endogone sp. FLAS-F59071]|nr:hypothetical protein BC937DRAFT_93520 [Endogone sp. FLAS-F59071]|eukprot:RUS14637.1 hypothetical protein BC937DRAFT_93520 [Endogone sp. FLAS-F59071]
MPRPTSDIWQYFTTVPSETKVKKAKCSFCGHEQSSGVTRLAQHLIEKCQAIPHNLRDELRTKADVKGKPVPGSSSAPYQVHDATGIEDPFAMLASSTHHHVLSSVPSSTLHHHFAGQAPTPQPAPQQRFAVQPSSASQAMSALSAPLDPQDQATMDWHLARAFYAAEIPFSAIEHPHFVDFFKRLRPGYVVPRKRRLQQFLLKTEHWDLLEFEVQKPDLMLDSGNGRGKGGVGRVGGAGHGSANAGPTGAVSENDVDMDATGL